MSETYPASRDVNFKDSLPLFFKNYVNFQERSSRGAFWWLVLWMLILGFAIGLVEAMLMPGLGPTDTGPLSSLFNLATLLPGIAITVRRLHDIGKSGWWILLTLTIIGIVLLIYWYCQPGQRADNTYGADKEAGVA